MSIGCNGVVGRAMWPPTPGHLVALLVAFALLTGALTLPNYLLEKSGTFSKALRPGTMKLLHNGLKLLLVASAVGLLSVVSTAETPHPLPDLKSFSQFEASRMAVFQWFDENHAHFQASNLGFYESITILNPLIHSLVDLTMEFWTWAAQGVPDQEIFGSVGVYFQSLLDVLCEKYRPTSSNYETTSGALREADEADPMQCLVANPYNILLFPLTDYYESFYLLPNVMNGSIWKLIEARSSALILLTKLTDIRFPRWEEPGNLRLPNKNEVESMVYQLSQAYEHYLDARRQLKGSLDSVPVYDYIFEPNLVEVSLSLEACRFHTAYLVVEKALGSPWSEEGRMYLESSIRKVMLGLERQFQMEIAESHCLDSGKTLAISLQPLQFRKQLSHFEDTLENNAEVGSMAKDSLRFLCWEARHFYRGGVQSERLRTMALNAVDLPIAECSENDKRQIAMIREEYLEREPVNWPIGEMHVYLADVAFQIKRLIVGFCDNAGSILPQYQCHLIVLLKRYYFLVNTVQPAQAAALYPLGWEMVVQFKRTLLTNAEGFSQSYSQAQNSDADLHLLFLRGGRFPALVNMINRVLCDLSPEKGEMDDQIISYVLPAGSGTRRAN